MTDDYLAFVAAPRQGLTTWMFPDLVVALAERRDITLAVAGAMLETIRPRFSMLYPSCGKSCVTLVPFHVRALRMSTSFVSQDLLQSRSVDDS